LGKWNVKHAIIQAGKVNVRGRTNVIHISLVSGSAILLEFEEPGEMERWRVGLKYVIEKCGRK
jgi:hypothetical protein